MPKPRRPKPKAKTALARVAKKAPPASTPTRHPAQLDAEQFVALRDLFWHNVVREMLGGLMVVAEKRPELLDGRFALLTHAGERIPIAQVTPVFGMSVRGTEAEQQASTAVQMTVFRVATPDGEVFTIPVHEVRGFHELTPELLARIQQAEDMEDESANGEAPRDSKPFGFAAFQALPKLPLQAPEHPTE